MKKVKLNAGYSWDFYLIGIISLAKEYTVSWSISNALNIQLKREEDLEIEIDGSMASIPCYLFETNFVRYSLVSNKILNSQRQQIRHLVPSLGQFDYLLKIEELEEIGAFDQVYRKLRDAQKLDTMVKLDVKKIKEKENLLF